VLESWMIHWLVFLFEGWLKNEFSGEGIYWWGLGTAHQRAAIKRWKILQCEIWRKAVKVSSGSRQTGRSTCFVVTPSPPHLLYFFCKWRGWFHLMCARSLPDYKRCVLLEIPLLKWVKLKSFNLSRNFSVRRNGPPQWTP
jgi:hypothetical protein